MTYTTTQRDCDRVELEARFKFERGQAWLSGAMVGAGVTGVLMIHHADRPRRGLGHLMIGALAARRAWRWWKRNYTRQYVTAAIAVLPWLR